MNAELIKSFENVINYYKSKPEYLDIVGTELYEKMYDLEDEILAYCDILDLAESSIDGGGFCKCMFCGRYFVDNVRCRYCIRYGRALEEYVKNRSIRLMFHNYDQHDRLIDYMQDLIYERNYNTFNICDECQDKYKFDTLHCCHKSELEESEEESEELKEELEKSKNSIEEQEEQEEQEQPESEQRKHVVKKIVRGCCVINSKSD